MTSSLIQSVSNASLASLAVRTASRAVKQPAVLGSRRHPTRRSTSRIEPRAWGLVRRRATVVSSVPDATRACSSASRLAAPPVPMISRDENARPAMTRGSGGLMPSPPENRGSGERGSFMSSTSLGGAEHLEPIVVVQARRGPGAAGHDLAVEGDGDAGPGRRVAEGGQQAGHGLARVDLGRLAVDDHGHGARLPVPAGRPANPSGPNGAVRAGTPPGGSSS